MMRSTLALMALGVALALCIGGAAAAQTVVVGSMNIQVFGTSKAANAPVMDILVRILQRFDVFAVQEIRDAGNTAFPALMQRLNANVTGIKTYAYVIGTRQGRTASKEQYAFVYDTAKFRVNSPTYEYPVALDKFERPPFAAQFEVIGYGAASEVLAPFVLVDVHTKPEAAVAEIDALADVYDAVAASFSNANVLTMGDYNAGCSYVSQSAWANIRFRTQTRFTWLIGDSVDTMQSSACPYDRFVVGGAALTAALIASSAKPFDYPAVWNISSALALDVSDHLPIQVTLTVRTTDPTATAVSSSGSAGGFNGTSTGLNAAARVSGTGVQSVAVALVAALIAAVATRRAL